MAMEWRNEARELYDKAHGDPVGSHQEPKGKISGLIRQASSKLFKMKLQYAYHVNDLWGEEVQGYATVVDNSPLGQLPIFQSRTIHEIRTRFSNVTNGDDAANDFRSAFLKFGDREEEGPCDLAFTTGRVSAFHGVESLQGFLGATEGATDNMINWALSRPENYYALVDGVRKCPPCLTCLDYHCHATYTTMGDGEIATVGSRKLMRFRLVGTHDVMHRLNAVEQETAWELGRPDRELPGDMYLHEGLRKVTENHRHMKLQVQLRDEGGTDDDSCLSPVIAWDVDKCPWQDLANLTFTYCVPKLASVRARYNFSHTQCGLTLVSGDQQDNYGELVHMREKGLAAGCRASHPEGHIQLPDSTTFLVHAETGNYLFSGTDGGIYIVIYGTRGRSDKKLLDDFFTNNFERGSRESFYIDVTDVGDVKYVKLFLIGGNITIGTRDWFLRSMALFDLNSRKLADLPYYRWITDTATVLVGQATLPQEVDDADMLYQRQITIQRQMSVLPWGENKDLPGRIGIDIYKDLPLDLMFASDREWERKKINTETHLKSKIHQYSTILSSFDSFDDFKRLTATVNKSETARLIQADDMWKTDAEFGRQFLAGVHPVLVRRCDAPLASFPVTGGTVDGLLDCGLSLEEEMQAGHVYYIDYKELVGFQTGDGVGSNRCLPCPIVMFYVRSTGEFVPIAVQLEQTAAGDNPIWTPNDADLDWLLVKTFVKSADAHYHNTYSHITRTHFIAESLAVAVFRRLPASHPVHKLLIPHVKYTIAVNTSSRGEVQGAESMFQKALALSPSETTFAANRYSKFHLDELSVPKDLETRGVRDSEKLPNYHYRDDALLLWHAIQGYVIKIIKLYYHSDEDVVQDGEIQSFIRDLADNGVKNCQKGTKGVPSSFDSIAGLVEFLTMFVFNCSCFHSAVNFGQLDYYMFGPNYPGAMRRPPPTRKGEVTMEQIIDTLPTKGDQSLVIACTHYLSEYSENEVFLGSFPDAHFTDQAAREAQQWFRTELDSISRTIKKRNATLDIPYVYLLPERIPNSVAQ